jgi:hypothetical protein
MAVLLPVEVRASLPRHAANDFLPAFRGVRSLPRLLLAAYVCVGVAVLITVVGIGLDLLPEDFDAEWNGLPLSEYGLGDVVGGSVLCGLAGALLAGLHLRRGAEGASPTRRRLATALVVIGLVPLAAVAAIVTFALLVCSGGACE